MVPRIADWCRVDLVDARGEIHRAVAHHADPERAKQGWELVNRLRAAADTPGSMAWVVKTGRSHLAQFDPPAAYDPARDRDLLTFMSGNVGDVGTHTHSSNVTKVRSSRCLAAAERFSTFTGSSVPATSSMSTPS